MDQVKLLSVRNSNINSNTHAAPSTIIEDGKIKSLVSDDQVVQAPVVVDDLDEEGNIINSINNINVLELNKKLKLIPTINLPLSLLYKINSDELLDKDTLLKFIKSHFNNNVNIGVHVWKEAQPDLGSIYKKKYVHNYIEDPTIMITSLDNFNINMDGELHVWSCLMVMLLHLHNMVSKYNL
jgi:hypothetical protein